MHVRTKRMATAGLLVAFVIVMLVLSSVIETNSLFLIAAASFCVGIVIREWGLKYGFVFLISSAILSVFLAPNKMYCITFAGMGVYLLMTELLWEKIAQSNKIRYRNAVLWFGRYLVFNMIYVPVLLFMPALVFSREVTKILGIVLFLVGQVALFVYEIAYRYFQAQIWGRLRVRLIGERNI